MTLKMMVALTAYLENIKIDYEKTCSSSQMKQEFNEGLHYAKGKKYIKVISGDRNGHKRVHSFISMGDDRFQEGDILLAASASSTVLPLTHSVARLELAIALPQPNVLNLASIILSSSTFI